MIEKIVVENNEVEVEFYYEKPEPETGFRGGYEIIEIDSLPRHFFREYYLDKVIEKLEERRIERSNKVG